VPTVLPVGLQEANDNVKFLKPLRKYLEKLNMMDEFQALAELFKPIMHLIMLIWKHSKYYNNAARFVTLMREICNDLIMQVRDPLVPRGASHPTEGLVPRISQACKFIPGPELIQMDPTEAVDKLRLTLRSFTAFKSYYFEYRTLSSTETPDNPWKFQNAVLFGRLDAFIERCHDMLEMQTTCLQFNKLER
jgi:dynein heavy chain, axonemal